MKRALIMGLAVLALLALSTMAAAAEEPMFGDAAIEALQKALEKASPQTKQCIACHVDYTPSIVYEWAMSKHAQSPASKAGEIYDKIAAPEWKDKIADWAKNYEYTVGCYECHGKYADQERPDVIQNHFGFKIVTVVTRKDCAQCHPKESAELSWTWHATGTLHATFLPWYKGILAKAKEMGANPFGDEEAKKLYEKYFPPYLTHKRDQDDIYWEFYKYLAADIMKYFETGEMGEYLKFAKEATGMVTPYDWDFKKWLTPLWPSQPPANTTLVRRAILPKLSKAYEKLAGTVTPDGIKIKAMGQVEAVVDNIMSHPAYRNGYTYHACIECHGSIVVPYGRETVQVETQPGVTMMVERVKLWGWPSNGAARVDPDGSHGTCTACHDRHMFSLKQAREPWTCGRCHLGYDHPHIEIYEESAHGNIHTAYGEGWKWEELPWKVGVDYNAPTCATCHMSTIARVDAAGNVKIEIPGTHDLVKRLVWDQMHFFGIPKGVIPDKPQQTLFLGGWSQLKSMPEQIEQAHQQIMAKIESGEYKNVPDEYLYPVFMGFKLKYEESAKPGEGKLPRMIEIEYSGVLAEHRNEMKMVCKQCHSSQWVDNYFRTADQNIIDYDIAAKFAFTLLKIAYAEGLADPKNPLDEFPELMWYYIWHHQGRRWRNGAFMMGPDFAHWYGVVDTIMEAFNKMVNWIALQLEVRQTMQELEALKAAAAGGQMQPALVAKIQELEAKLAQLQAKLAALEATAASLKQQLQSFEGGFAAVEEQVTGLQTNIEELQKQLEQLTQQLEQLRQMGVPEEQLAQLQSSIAQLQQLIEQTKAAAAKAEEQAKAASERAAKAEEKAMKAEEEVAGIKDMLKEILHKLELMDEKIGAVSRNTYALAGLALALAVIALGLAVARRQ